MPRIRLDGLTVHYQQAGSGPEVVLIHAFTSNLAVWVMSGVIEALARDFRVTAYDLRGHGASDVPRSGYTSAHHAEDLRQLHAALELAPAYLVGHSFGGVVATHAALCHPEIVSGLILADTYFPGLQHLEPDMGTAGPWQDLRQAFLAAGVEIGARVDFARLFDTVAGLDGARRSALHQSVGPAGTRWLASMGQLAGTTAGQEIFDAGDLAAERIRTVRQPVVALYDEHSPFRATCDYLERSLPSCKVAIVPGARHLAPLQNAEVFQELARRHLLEMAGTASPREQAGP
jgi:pimeloyl-ACP methyl ester carboxylesterase